MLRRKNRSKNNSQDKRGIEPINDDLCEVLKNSPIKLYTEKGKELKRIDSNSQNQRIRKP